MSGEDLTDLLGPDPAPAPPRPAKRPGVHTSPAALKQAGGREVFLRSRSYPVVGKLNTPARLKKLVTQIGRMPVATDACRVAGISYTTLKYWLQKSLEGTPGDGFDVPVDVQEEGDEPTVRFHIAWADAMEFGVSKIEVAMINKALGQLEPLTFQGRVIYKQDPQLVALGLTGIEAYMKDEFGAPIPETVMKQDPDLMQFVLKARRPEVYGNKQQIDVTHRGGVLVVGAVAKTAADLNLAEEEFRRIGRPPVMFEDEEPE